MSLNIIHSISNEDLQNQILIDQISNGKETFEKKLCEKYRYLLKVYKWKFIIDEDKENCFHEAVIESILFIRKNTKEQLKDLDSFFEQKLKEAEEIYLKSELKKDNRKYENFLFEYYRPQINFLKKDFGFINLEDCESVYQDAFMDLIKKIKSDLNNDIRNIEAYFKQILKFKALRHKGELKKSVFAKENEEDILSYDELMQLTSSNVENLSLKLIPILSEKMSQKCWTLLLKFYAYDFSWKELSEEEGYSSEGSARGAGHDCRKKAKDLGGKYFNIVCN